MRVLLDTCVLSELRRPSGHGAVLRAVMSIASEDLYISVVSVGEIVSGIASLAVGARKRGLEDWLRELIASHHDQLVPVDLETCRIWGELLAAAKRSGRIVPAIDGLIAATAHQHGLRVMTRNISDFEPTGVLLMNPWADGN